MLVVPKCIVLNVVADNRTVLDVHCVFNCRTNGHNATLWAAGFMMDIVLDVANQAVK